MAEGKSAQGRLAQLLARFARLFRPQAAGVLTGLAFDLVRSRRQLLIENALLRQQLLVLKRRVPRPSFKWRQRVSLVFFSCLALDWKRAIFIVEPATVLRWQRQFYQWMWKRRSKPMGSSPHSHWDDCVDPGDGRGQ